MQMAPLTTSTDAQHSTPRRPMTDEQDRAPHPRLARARGRTLHSSHTTACALRPTRPANAGSMAPSQGHRQQLPPLPGGQTHHCPRSACHSPRCRPPPTSSRAARSCAYRQKAAQAAAPRRHLHHLRQHLLHSPQVAQHRRAARHSRRRMASAHCRCHRWLPHAECTRRRTRGRRKKRGGAAPPAWPATRPPSRSPWPQIVAAAAAQQC